MFDFYTRLTLQSSGSLCGLCHTTWLPEGFVPGSFMAERVLAYHSTVEKDSVNLSREEK